MDLLKHDNCILENFKFQNGAVLENVNVAYSTMGKPKYDDEGKITNLILLSHSYEESFESYWGKDIILSEDFLFDRKDYFFVFIISSHYKSCTKEVRDNFVYNCLYVFINLV